MNGISPKLPASAQPMEAQQGDKKASFKEVWEDIQMKMGAKPKKVRTAKKQLDKDDFLKIMVMQMKHQDPTKPFDVDKMATELAQMTSVEQLKNMNAKMDKLISTDRPADRLAMTTMIGKTVSVDQNRFIHQKGEPRSLSYQLPDDASDVKVVIINDKGQPVFEKSLGRQEAGPGSFTWDGKKTGGALEADGGNYLLQVQAQNKDGHPMPIDVKSKGKIIGVSFEGSEPVFLVGDHQNQVKIPMSSVTVIENPTEEQVSGQEPVKPIAKNASNFFTFEKGVGSKPVDLASLNQADKAAISKYKAQKTSEKGFPSGLQDNNKTEKEVKSHE